MRTSINPDRNNTLISRILHGFNEPSRLNRINPVRSVEAQFRLAGDNGITHDPL